MPIIKFEIKSDFVPLPNTTARDRRLSLEASGFLSHILSYSKGFKASNPQLQKLFGIGRDKVTRITKELKFFGYLVISPGFDTDGDFDGANWTFYNISQLPEKSKAEFREQLKTRIPPKAAQAIANKQDAGANGADSRTTENAESAKRGGRETRRPLRKTIHKEGKTKIGKKKNENETASAVRALAFSRIAFHVYGVPESKIQFMPAKQTNLINSELDKLANLDADLSALEHFGAFWSKNWRSIDRLYKTFQRVRVEQFSELWFEFYSSAELTNARLEAQKQFEQEKQGNDTTKTTGSQDKFAGHVQRYEYDDFADIGFDD